MAKTAKKNKEGKLAYSEFSGKVYWVKSGNKIDVTDNFIQMVLCWINDGKLPPIGHSKAKQLSSADIVNWEIECKRISE